MGKRKSVRKPLLEEEDNEQGVPFYEEESLKPVAEGGHCVEQSDSPSQQYSCRVSGPGLEAATANYPTRVLVELRDQETGQPCTQSQTVSAELTSELEKEDKHGLFRRKHKSSRVTIDQKTAGTYLVSFTAVSRGEHKLHIQIDGVEVGGSPCNITVFPDPNQLRKPVGEVPHRTNTWGVAVNSRGDIITSDYVKNEIVVMNSDGGVISAIDCRGPTGVTVDDDDNIYVSCTYEIRKFSREGQLVKSKGQRGSGEGEFISSEGITHHKDLIYVCDTLNNRIQVLDTDLNYVRTMGSEGSGNIEFAHPSGIDFDSAGRAYVADKKNSRVQVIDVKRGGFLKEIGHSGGRGRLGRPTGVHVVGEFVYVSDDDNCRVAVFRAVTGEFVTSFAGHSDSSGKKYRGPFRICSTKHKQCFIYVFDLISAHIF